MQTRPNRPVALVTGATAGLGSVFASTLAAQGHDLVLVARDGRRLQARATELQNAHGAAAEVIAADLATDEGVARVVARLKGTPAVDVLVNNAGFGTIGAFGTTDPDVQERMVRLHVLAVNSLTRAALAPMLERGRGAIVTVSSVASFLTSAGNANYCGTKAYQRMLMEAIAVETAGSGVLIQALCPGFIHTEFHQRGAMRTSHIPKRLWMSANEVVDASLSALRRGGPTVVIPRLTYRFIVGLLRYLPRSLLARGTQSYRRDRAAR